MDRDDPFGEIGELFEDLTRLGQAGEEVPVDVVDAGDAYVVVADLPGYDAADIDVELYDDHRLRIEAERETETVAEEGTYVRRERRREATSRSVTLPGPVDEDATEAGYEDGVLKIRLGKRAGEDEGTDIPVG